CVGARRRPADRHPDKRDPTGSDRAGPGKFATIYFYLRGFSVPVTCILEPKSVAAGILPATRGEKEIHMTSQRSATEPNCFARERNLHERALRLLQRADTLKRRRFLRDLLGVTRASWNVRAVEV